jgi:UDP-glucose 4-epimerase
VVNILLNIIYISHKLGMSTYNETEDVNRRCHDKLGSTLVTGGAGFIGSHIVDKLISINVDEVTVLDKLFNGSLNFISEAHKSAGIDFIEMDLREIRSIESKLREIKSIFHMAAYPEVRTGFDNAGIYYRENVTNTLNILEMSRKNDIENFIFASTSTIYGEPHKIPTPEDYGPLIPISLYGASKLACEAMVAAYCISYGIAGIIYRMANIIGSRSRHGVIVDFIRKLKENKHTLQILGNGLQSKSYLHISDCIDCFFFCLSKSNNNVDIFNVSNEDKLDVISVADIVCDTMNLRDIKYSFTGGTNNDGRGWVGDVTDMLLDMTKLKHLGWKPNLSSKSAVFLASKELIRELQLD